MELPSNDMKHEIKETNRWLHAYNAEPHLTDAHDDMQALEEQLLVAVDSNNDCKHGSGVHT